MKSLADSLFALDKQHTLMDWFSSTTLIIVLALALFYLLYLVLLKSSKSKFNRDFHIRITLLWALALMQVVLGTYLFFVFRNDQVPEFTYEKPLTYLCFLPHLLLYLAIIFLFTRNFLRLREETQSA
ncbi:MAG: hypothetical protein AAFZ63_20685 [Bacteroidota bacterium]